MLHTLQDLNEALSSFLLSSLKNFCLLVVETSRGWELVCRPCSIPSSDQKRVLPRFTLHLILLSRVTRSVSRREEIRRKEECIVWRHHFQLMLVTWHGPGHVIHIQQFRNRVLEEVLEEEDELLLQLHPLFNWQEEIQHLVCWPEEFRWQMVIESASFCRCWSCDFTDLNTTTGKEIPNRDWFSCQEVMIYFTGTSSVQTTGGEH